MPVLEHGEIVGSLTQNKVLNFILENPLENTEKTVDTIMGPTFPIVSLDVALKDLNQYITKEVPAVVTKDTHGEYQIVTQYDIVQAI
jgi:cystathionine beta-synthase